MYEDFLECQKNYSVYLDSVENVVRTLGLLENVKNNSQLLGIVKEIRFTVEDILKILEVGLDVCFARFTVDSCRFYRHHTKSAVL